MEHGEHDASRGHKRDIAGRRRLLQVSLGHVLLLPAPAVRLVNVACREGHPGHLVTAPPHSSLTSQPCPGPADHFTMTRILACVPGFMSVPGLSLCTCLPALAYLCSGGLFPAAWWLWTNFSSGKLANVCAILWVGTALSLMRSDSLPRALSSCPSYPLEFSLYFLVTLLF